MSLPFQYRGDLTLSLHVSHLHASIAWYEQMLGFQVLYVVEKDGWCEMSGPAENVRIGLGQTEKMKTGGCVPVSGVVDIVEARAWLDGKSVRFDGPIQEIPGLVKLATFYDPDGNPWMLAQSLPRS